MTAERVVLFHWHLAEATQRLQELSEAGFQPELCADEGSSALRKQRAAPPDAFVIDLTRLPAQGRAVGIWLRQQRALRLVPLVFAGGSPEKVESTRALLPDATFCDWSSVGEELREAISSPVRSPVVPGTMAGYSGTPLVKKLGIKPGSVLALLGAPDRFDGTLGALPPGVRVRRRAQGRADKILLFVRTAAELERRFPSASRVLAEGGGLWLVWPKKSSGVASDLSQAHVRCYGLEHGFVDYKICSVDEVWSGLLFARRAVERKRREGDEAGR